MTVPRQTHTRGSTRWISGTSFI